MSIAARNTGDLGSTTTAHLLRLVFSCQRINCSLLTGSPSAPGDPWGPGEPGGPAGPRAPGTEEATEPSLQTAEEPSLQTEDSVADPGGPGGPGGPGRPGSPLVPW